MKLSHAVLGSLGVAALTLSGCGGSGDEPKPAATSSPTSASTSAATTAPIAVNVAGLIVTEAAFPAGGTFTLADDAALDAEDAVPDTAVYTPAECKESLTSGTDDATDDRARATSTFNNRDLQVQIGATTKTFDEGYADVESAIANCAQLQATEQLEDGSTLVIDFTVAVSQRTLGAVTVGEVAIDSSATVDGALTTIPVHTLLAKYEGVSIAVTLNKTDGIWEPADTTELEALMQAQIDKIAAAT